MKRTNILRWENKASSRILRKKLLICIARVTYNQRIIVIHSLKTLIEAKPLFIHRKPNRLHPIRQPKPPVIRRLLNRILAEKIHILYS